MQAAIEQFRANVERVRNLGSVEKALSVQTTNALDLSDILRAEIVLVVSALDHYVHEITRLGMLDIYRGARKPSPAFERFNVSMSSVLLLASNRDNEDWLEREIRNRHGHQSFQKPDSIAGAVRLFADVQLWDEVGRRIGTSATETKERLDLIVNRRNQIAHEADMNRSYPMVRWHIDADMVLGIVDFIEQVAEAIYDIVG